MVSVNRARGIHLYTQISQSLRDEIAARKLLPGQKLPSEDDLAVRFGVSRMTVRRSVVDLMDAGLLYRRQGVGTFIAQPHLERDHTRLSGLAEGGQDGGLRLSVRVLAADVLPAKSKVAQSLSLKERELVVRLRTLHLAAGAPIAVHESCAPYALFPQLLQEDLKSQYVWEVLESHGFRVRRAVQRVDAREVHGEIAHLLKLDDGAPILYKERIVYLDDGTPVEFTCCHNRGDMYSITSVLSR